MKFWMAEEKDQMYVAKNGDGCGDGDGDGAGECAGETPARRRRDPAPRRGGDDGKANRQTAWRVEMNRRGKEGYLWVRCAG